MQVEMEHVFFEFSDSYQGSNDEFFIDLKASYIQTDRRYCHQSCKLEAEASSLEKYVLQDILSFESPLLPTSLLKLCSQIIWLDYTGARASRIFFILINPMWTIFRLREATARSPTETDAAAVSWWSLGLFFISHIFNGKWRFGDTINIWKMKWYFPILEQQKGENWWKQNLHLPDLKR